MSEICPEGFVPGRIKNPTERETINNEIFKRITADIPAIKFINYYLKHTQIETMEYFGIRTKQQLRRILIFFNYDFSTQKGSNKKGKPSERSHESYIIVGQKSAKTQKENWKNKTEEEKTEWSEKMSASHKTEQYKELKAAQNRKIWYARTEEERQEINKKRSETMKNIIENLSDEEKGSWITRSYKKYKYDGEYFDSFPELCFYLYHKSIGKDIKRSKLQIPYFFQGEKHIYLPDFELEGQIIEIKGDHLFEQLLIPDTLDNAKYHCMLENNVTILTSSEYRKYEDWFKETGLDKSNFFNISSKNIV